MKHIITEEHVEENVLDIQINPKIPEETRELAIKQILRSESQKLIVNNESFHKMLVDGISIPITKGREEMPKIDEEFEEATEGKEIEGKDKPIL